MEIEKLSDEELAVLVRTKDQELYRYLVQRYQKKLRRYSLWLVGDQDRAADVVQEAFIKAFINLRSFDAKKKFSSWIYRIVHNQALNLIKKEKKKISLDFFSGRHQLVNGEPEAIEVLARKEVQAGVRRSLDKLPVIYREPLALFYLDDKNYGEISDILRLPVGTVGTRINRAKKIMKSLLKSEGEK